MTAIMAGRLDRRVTLQRMDKQRAPGSGETTLVPVDVVTVWAEKRPLQGREAFEAGQLAAKVDTVWTVRWWRNDLTPEWRLKDPADAGRFYQIRAVLELGRREGLELHTESRAEEVRA